MVLLQVLLMGIPMVIQVILIVAILMVISMVMSTVIKKDTQTVSTGMGWLTLPIRLCHKRILPSPSPSAAWHFVFPAVWKVLKIFGTFF